MHRTQVIIEQWQYEYLKSASEEKGKSISELIREMITSSIDKDSPSGSLSLICGLGEDHDGFGKDHDKLLYGKVKNNA